MPQTITKSQYLNYLQCPLYAWLAKNRKDLKEFHETLAMKQGNAVEEVAQGLFPKGVEVKGYYETGTRQTKDLIEKGVKVIYQAQAMTDKFLARGDILVKRKDGWHLYEVKGGTHKKDKHVNDLRFQANAFHLAGIELAGIYLIHANKDYRFDAKKGLEPKKFLVTLDLTDEIREGMDDELKQMKKAHKILTAKKEPELIRRRKFDYDLPPLIEAEYYKNIPEYSIYDLVRIAQDDIESFTKQGVNLITDIPETAKLNAKQRQQVELTKKKGKHIDKKAIKTWLDKLEYPLYFFDYETIQLAIPVYDGAKPWQQIPMQYSLHVLKKPGGKLEHYEYLHMDKSAPFEPLCKSFRSQVGDKGSVISWNMSFEKKRNEEMAEMLPAYKDFLLDVNERTVDLMDVYKTMYVDYRFKGSSSLKKVLPVLVPKLDYGSLGIQAGGDASEAIYKMIFEEVEDKEETIRWLLEYCEMDTEAMVRLYEALV